MKFIKWLWVSWMDANTGSKGQPFKYHLKPCLESSCSYEVEMSLKPWPLKAYNRIWDWDEWVTINSLISFCCSEGSHRCIITVSWGKHLFGLHSQRSFRWLRDLLFGNRSKTTASHHQTMTSKSMFGSLCTLVSISATLVIFHWELLFWDQPSFWKLKWWPSLSCCFPLRNARDHQLTRVIAQWKKYH